MKRSTLLTFLVLVALVLIVVFLEKPFAKRGNREVKTDVETFFPEYNADSVQKIVISTRTRTPVQFVKHDNEWWVLDGGEEYPTDVKSMDGLLDKVDQFTMDELVSTNAEKHPMFEVDESGVDVRMLGSGDTVLAHFIVGKNGPDFLSTYLRRADEDEVYKVKLYLKSFYDKDVKYWKDREILSIEKESLRRLCIENTGVGRRICFERTTDNEEWRMTSPVEMEVEQTRVNQIINTFGRMLANDYARLEEGDDGGLSQPTLRIDLVLDDGSEKGIRFGREEEKKGYYVRSTQRQKYTFLLPKYRFGTYDKDIDHFRIDESSEEPAKPE